MGGRHFGFESRNDRANYSGAAFASLAGSLDLAHVSLGLAPRLYAGVRFATLHLDDSSSM